MSAVQSVLYFAVTVPAALGAAVVLSDTGYYRHRVDTDWVVFTIVAVWALALVGFVWTLIA